MAALPLEIINSGSDLST